MDGLIAFLVLVVVAGCFYLNKKSKDSPAENKPKLFYIGTIKSGAVGDFVTTYGFHWNSHESKSTAVHFEPTPALLKCGGFKVSCDESGDIFKVSILFYVNSDTYQYNYQEKIQAFSELDLLGYLTVKNPYFDDGEFPIYKNGKVRS